MVYPRSRHRHRYRSRHRPIGAIRIQKNSGVKPHLNFFRQFIALSQNSFYLCAVED